LTPPAPPLARSTSNPPTLFEFTCQPLHAEDLTNLGRELLASSYPIPTPWADDNPFVSEDYKVFMRFDGLLIGNSGLTPDEVGVSLGFLWRNRVMCLLQLEGTLLEGNSSLHLRHIEGRQRMALG
jgi:hypothetical protein